jgi:hypothetical protein
MGRGDRTKYDYLHSGEDFSPGGFRPGDFVPDP